MKLPLSFRSSGIGPTLSCPGRITAIPLVPAKPDDDSSIEGTSIHYVIADRLVKEDGATPPDDGLQPPKGGIQIQAFSAWVPDFCLRFVRDTVPPDWSLMVEAEFEHAYTLPNPVAVPLSEIEGPIPADHEVAGDAVLIRYVIITSHVDLIAQSPDGKRIIAADWKTGQVGADAAPENEQAASYMTQIKLAWPDTESVRFFMVQPRIDEEATGIDRITDVELNGAELDRLNAMTCKRLEAAIRNRFITNSGPKQCRYCPVNGPLCPSIQAEKDHAMKAELTKERIAALKAGIDDKTLADFVIAGRTLNPAFEAATEEAKERIREKGYLDGSENRITVATRGGSYEITDDDGFYDAMCSTIPDERARYRASKPSMTRVKEAISDAQGIPKKSKVGISAESVFADKFGPCVQQKQVEMLVIT